jgi:hypothetical protein
MRLCFLTSLFVLIFGFAQAEPIDIRSSAIDLNPENPNEKTVGKMRFLGGIELRSEHAEFGGLSGMVVSADGNDLTAVTDQGYRLTAKLARDNNGAIIGLLNGDLSLIHGTDNRPLKDAKTSRDAEGMTARANGNLCVSFERKHRVYCYRSGADPLISEASRIKLPKDVKKASPNGGLEAITELADGRLLVLTEKYRDDKGNFVSWIISQNSNARLTYQAVNVLHPVDMATLSDGTVLILERHYSPMAGVTNRLGKIEGSSIKAGALLISQELFRLRQPYSVDNYEALAIWQTNGRTIVHILSDDNFNVLQRTLLLSFEIIE